MADGVRFDIAIEANGVGVDATAESLNALAAKIDFTNKVATTFDRAVTAVRARLEEAAAATKTAAEALGAAEKRYAELETAANKAAKEVEKAAAAGKDTAELTAAAAQATAKMREQAAAVDALRLKSDAAAAAQSKLAGTLKTLEGQQSAAAAQIKAGIAKELQGVGDKAKAAAGPDKVGGMERYGKVVKGLGSATAMAAAAWLVFAAAGVAAVGAMAKFGFGIPQNVANMQRLQLAQQRMQLGMQKLFAGLKWDGFTRGLEQVMTLFDQGTSSANGMKKLTETVLQPLIDAATAAMPYVKEFFKGLIYGALQVVIAVLKIRNAIFSAISPETRAIIKGLSDSLFTLENAFTLGTVAAIVLAGVFALLTASLVSLGITLFLTFLPLLLIIGAIALIVAAIMDWEEWVGAISDTLSDWGDAAADAASALIDGLVDGIKNGAAAVIKALKNLALSGVDAFKGALGIASPSKVMKLQASYTTQGFVEGLEEGEAQVATASESLATAATDGVSSAPGPTPAAAPAGAKSGTVINFTGPISFGSDADRSMFAEFTKMLADALGGATITIGGGEAPAT